MSLRNKHLLEFGDFRLDLAERLLFQGMASVAITPKAFETLRVLVERAGHLVEKDELMKTVWPDRFVEESNLTFNIKMIRKALGDNAAAPTFIETVPRRGYRFIAKVNNVGDEIFPDAELRKPELKAGNRRRRTFGYLVPLFAAAGIIAIGLWLWYGRIGASETSPPILAAAFSSESLSSSGRVLQAAISPDGKLLAYTNGLGSEKQSLWLRELNSSNNVQIIPPTDDFYFDLAFSPDSGSIYFVRGPKPGDPAIQNAVYRMSIFGGAVTKLVDQIQGTLSISPEGDKLSFVRCDFRNNEWCSLWLADAADGKNERKLLVKPRPFRISDSAISSDGRKIVFATGQSRNGANDFTLAEVDIETGVEKEFTTERFFDIKGLLWLPDGKSLLATALRFPDKNFRIWRIPAGSGPAEPLSNSPDDYAGITLDREARNLVATHTRPDFHLNLYQQNDASAAKQISAEAATVTFGPDGSLAISKGRRGNHDIWSMNSEGVVDRQLTSDPLDDLDPLFSPDGSTIFFVSNRTGKFQVWRMKRDGSDQRQITTGDGGYPIALSPDGKWLYYHAALERTLMRVSPEGGVEETVIDKIRPLYTVSPDCTMAALPGEPGGESIFTIVSLADGSVIRSMPSEPKRTKVVGMTWSADSKALFFISAVNDYENNTLWMLATDKAEPRKLFDLRNEGVRNDNSFAVSPDGKSFAVVQGNWQRDAVLIKGFK